MSHLLDTLVPHNIYNRLPHIKTVSEAPTQDAEGLEVLRKILEKHNLPSIVCVRLIHKHFDAEPGEVMVFENVCVPNYGIVKSMKPIRPTEGSSPKLRGLNFFVTEDASLQAYEYTVAEGNHFEWTNYGPFLEEFCHTALEKSLQHKFGLCIKENNDIENKNWTEFEFHAKRSTIMLQDGMPMPEGDFDFTVLTEWPSASVEGVPGTRGCSHACSHVCRHGMTCNHKDKSSPLEEEEEDSETGELFLGGHHIEKGTAIYDLLNAIAIQAF